MESGRWNLQGKKALITGGAKGIGCAIANEFLQLGAEICIVARDKKQIDDTVSKWRSAGFKAYGISSNFALGDEACHTVINQVLETWDTLDILVNNAGINIRKKAEEYTRQEYAEIMQVNLATNFNMCQFAFPLLKKSSQGNIVN